MKRNLHLLMIDPQNDFCDLPASYLPTDPVTRQPLRPALPVPGAHQDMLRLAGLINRGRAGISALSVTLDSHHRFDIAHPTFWTAAGGAAVAPFTEITAADVRAQKYLPRHLASLPIALNYLDRLEAAGRYQLMVWPVHCEIGSWGHNVHADVRAAYGHWEDAALGIVAKLAKGSNPWTEHYSAVQAEVPDADDPDTQFNYKFVRTLAEADRIYVAGEAGSHCVKATVEHIADYFEQQYGAASLAKLALVTDCISPVSGFEAQYQDFLQAMAARGVQLLQSSDALAELIANAGEPA
ncbi:MULTISPECIES: cysteine hydrolase [unclassified Duganella]|uniref:cysteine hydrolase n=1 Tax=unclassified Duganella TaxID=2636909 RepID=UPI0008871CDC|nr:MULTISPECIES: cysteine hydrolase [unclassified Duganella]SDH32246.1 Nicotinamidase-related amidase [Duganella sp. OV458]SDK49035.1 Nicotinamidase-related amidase [Duganella sp. OV510]